MSRPGNNPPSTFTDRIVLTPIEDTLRSLLLDVVDFIRKTQPEQNGGHNSKSEPKLELRFTGGWVRDKLLGVGSHDIDVGISTMTGYQFGLALKDYLDVPANLENYKKLHDGELKDSIVSLHKIAANPEKSKHLETVATKIFGLDIDLVNLRKEKYTDESRNPQMEFGTPEEDALRRDATVNAMFYNLHTRSLEDFTGRGQDDMRKELLRTPLPPYQTFKDDPLRVLRLIRFASRLGYTIEEQTEVAMRHDDIKYALKAKISPERVGTEIVKTLKGPDPKRALETINRLGLYNTIFSNRRDEEVADTSTWERAYNSVPLLLGETHANTSDELKSLYKSVGDILIRDKTEDTYNFWLLASLSPWGVFPAPKAQPDRPKPDPPLSTAVARDSLRNDNKTLTFLTSSVRRYPEIVAIKNAIGEGSMTGSEAEIRQKVGQAIRQLGVDWRLCVVHAILMDIMETNDTEKVLQSYDKLFTYIRNHDLIDVVSLKPLVRGQELKEALGVKQGPWVTSALEMVINWQLRNPTRSDKEGALEEVVKRKDELDLSVISVNQKGQTK
ncbi:CCA tRNA nucleotidyltransferase, mitochondrial [Arachnomyces sp. PD_36]|nr:CCA tRNA nucleotidyltransferase, mitochondrial [Arachnomyces sp. PD_36]